MHAVLIRNPISGNPHRQHALDQALTEFASAGWRLDIRQTERKGHARQLAQEAAEQGQQRIIIAGGDGSIGQVADGIVRSGRTDVRMGIIPLGTGNVFAREMGLPFPRSSRDDAAVRAVRIILAEDAKPLDVGVANGQAFLCWAGCGIDANVTEEVETNLAFDKRQSPLKTYIVALLKQLRGFKSSQMCVTVDGQVIASTGGEPDFQATILPQRIQKVQRYSFQRPFIEAYRLALGFDRWQRDGVSPRAAVDATRLAARVERHDRYRSGTGRHVGYEHRGSLQQRRCITDAGPGGRYRRPLPRRGGADGGIRDRRPPRRRDRRRIRNHCRSGGG